MCLPLPRSTLVLIPVLFFFFFNDTATTEIYTLSLHDALPISLEEFGRRIGGDRGVERRIEADDLCPGACRCDGGDGHGGHDEQAGGEVAHHRRNQNGRAHL